MKRKKLSHITFNKLKRIKVCQNPYCKITTNLERHHIKPLSIGGTNNIKNIIILCQKCHIKEHEKLFLKEFGLK